MHGQRLKNSSSRNPELSNVDETLRRIKLATKPSGAGIQKEECLKGEVLTNSVASSI